MPTPEEIMSMSSEEVVSFGEAIVNEIKALTDPSTGRIQLLNEELSTRALLHYITFNLELTIEDMKKIVLEGDPEGNDDLEFVLAQMAGILYMIGNSMNVINMPGHFEAYKDDVITISKFAFALLTQIRSAVLNDKWVDIYRFLDSENLMGHLNQSIEAVKTSIDSWGMIRPELPKSSATQEEGDSTVDVFPPEVAEAMERLGVDSLDPIDEVLAGLEPGQRAAVSVAFADPSPVSEEAGTSIFGRVPRSGSCGEIVVRDDGMVAIWDWADPEESALTGTEYAWRLIGHESAPDIHQTIARFRDWQAAYYEIQRWLIFPNDGKLS